ncbi:GNAT family N-acetyltransferase [Paenibacillus sp. N4]|uniref:GNAT family N-acetyltransferase n=1 Tax=Paenibacillus vietnamensis TaxID=2590547 RepID=UPI001CD04800|nr:GNAT family N-acetyltransferase [Paenibacillus vietnamensis]MCA0753773.1 GNAT family N-acetyltransferase [Paenibacillus vietnamensis]
MSNDYNVQARMPVVTEYLKLCTAVGWKDFMNFDAAEQSLKSSLYGVVVEYKDEIVGMGRVVGDGHIYFYIQDIAVMPEHQNKGIGKLIMAAITDYIKEHAPEKAFVGLFSAQGKESFYNQFGFHRHDGLTGMFGVVHEREIK